MKRTAGFGTYPSIFLRGGLIYDFGLITPCQDMAAVLEPNDGQTQPGLALSESVLDIVPSGLFLKPGTACPLPSKAEAQAWKGLVLNISM